MGTKLTAKQSRVIAAMAAGATIAEAARRCEINGTTIDRWLKQPEFKKALRAAIGEIWQQSLARAAGAASSAIEVLVAIATNPDASDRNRISAASEVLRHAERWQDLQLEARVETLEAIVDGKQPS